MNENGRGDPAYPLPPRPSLRIHPLECLVTVVQCAQSVHPDAPDTAKLEVAADEEHAADTRVRQRHGTTDTRFAHRIHIQTGQHVLVVGAGGVRFAVRQKALRSRVNAPHGGVGAERVADHPRWSIAFAVRRRGCCDRRTRQ
eukprot:ctg_382.g247